MAAALVVVLTVLLVVRLFELHFSTRIILPDDRKAVKVRGNITDRGGRILAMSIETESLYADPGLVDDPDSAALRLAAVLGLNPSWIKARLGKDKSFVWIQRKLNPGTAEAVRKLRIRGLGFRKEYKRVYPEGRLASNILGFVNAENRGMEGLEYHFESSLCGEEERLGSDANDVMVYGKTLQLTIDRFIQYSAEKELDRAVARYGAGSGAAVVMEVKTGRILAFAKSPGFDPNYYYRFSRENFRHFSFTDTFEPGSTMKIFALASALEANPSLRDIRINCKGESEIADVIISCTKPHGELGLEGIVTHSCNSGVIELMKRVKQKTLYEGLKRFGFGEQTGVELPGESSGILREEGRWSGLSKFSISIGYEMSVNSIQLTSAFASVANGGVYMSPMIVESIISRDRSWKRGFYPRSKGKVLSEKTASLMMSLMRNVVREGTGRGGAPEFYSAAGKTGTSKKFSRKEGVYSSRSISSFAGIVPYENPALCILVVLDDPGVNRSGGEVAAPVFAAIADRVLPLMGLGGRYEKPGKLRNLGSGKSDAEGKTGSR